MSSNKVSIEDLKYELRMLLGAAEIVKQVEQHDDVQNKDTQKFGNIVNYFKDSAYLHTRNLYNFFSGCAVHDGSVHDYTLYAFNLSLYKKWKKPLHQHVLHISNARSKPRNKIDGAHINTQIPCFAKDIESLWDKWIEVTTDSREKRALQGALTRAQNEAKDDCNNFVKLIKKDKNE